FALGVEPLALMRSAMELCHRVTVAQVGKGDARAISDEERKAIEGWAQELSAGQLHRLWQLLLKGHDEVRVAPDPLAAAEMALLRCLHAAEMPDPGQLVKRIEAAVASGALAASSAGGGAGAEGGAAPGARAMHMPGPDWAQLVEKVSARHVRIGQVMHDWMQVVELRAGLLRYTFAAGYSEDCARELARVLEEVTGQEWQTEHVAGASALQPTLRQLADGRRADEDAAMRRSPLVEAALAAFPEAQFIQDDTAAGGYDRGRANRSR
ncbi:MAG TPA: DNA polymerase III subunit gamma/tau, partial [Novosphingobium sp.]|nr:DNA polymerase III subunit gamma/tau [Novosphingobium sp.]